MILSRARRLASFLWHALARRALLMLCLWHTGGVATAETVSSARFEDPTDRYAHGVLGDGIEHGTLTLRLTNGIDRRFSLPETSVFEDTAPRLVDIDGDRHPEVLVVEADQTRGARLAIYGPGGRVTATPYIGTRFRWLAPLGAADLDGDGRIEIAYVDRPHLAKTLRIWRFEQGSLTEVASTAGVTNHQIGETDIAGGIRNCAGKAEMILADARWQNLLSLTFDGTEISARRIGGDTSRAGFAEAMRCGDR